MNIENQNSILQRMQNLSIECRIDADTQQHYSRDESVATKGHVLAVCFPKNTEQVQNVVRVANELNIPIIPRGAGSGLSGAAVPFQDSLIVSLEHMNRILDIDKLHLRARVQPGVITGDIRKAVEHMGL